MGFKYRYTAENQIDEKTGPCYNLYVDEEEE